MLGLTATVDDEPLARRRRDRRLFGGLVAAAMLSFITLDYLGRPIVAVAAYWTFVVGAATVVYRSDAIMDERDLALERITSLRAIQVVGAALVVLGPGIGALSEAGIYDAPPVVDGVLFGWVAVFVVWGVAYGATRLQR
ncbi:hypothetical protein G9C85_16960 [Halorubellus sp. JP-L1]|uniref:hypothetical protein n=1 Tax=Halorubellus sp. JP-L1 TaxID=2715753 RepID=UPI00140B0968|nr:hypothetical protein [Halorubellus sp. JP-L1]NHN43310.1 hypothetical protein [Halorubellus sp. JP-L1]